MYPSVDEILHLPKKLDIDIQIDLQLLYRDSGSGIIISNNADKCWYKIYKGFYRKIDDIEETIDLFCSSLGNNCGFVKLIIRELDDDDRSMICHTIDIELDNNFFVKDDIMHWLDQKFKHYIDDFTALNKRNLCTKRASP